MTNERIIQLLNTERNCVIRAQSCDRNCAKCELVQDTDDLLEMYDAVIAIMKQRQTRVLTASEIIDEFTPDVLWLERRDGDNAYLVPGVWQLDRYQMCNGDEIGDLGMEIAECPEAYGREWRVWWPERPTDEMREAVKWGE